MTAAASRAYLNSYDLFKLLALIIMTADHLGAYLFADELWLRALGRCSFPIWLFLAGYGARLPISRSLLLGAISVVLLDGLMNEWLALNILFSIIISRLLLKLLERSGYLQREPLTVAVGCMMLAPFTALLWDYGSFALLFAALGYYRFHDMQDGRIRVVFVSGWCAYIALQCVSFAFEPWHIAVVFASSAACAFWMWHFHANRWTLNAPKQLIVRAAHLLSRYSLHYYVAHLAALTALHFWLIQRAS